MGSGRCAVRPGIQGRSGVGARQMCSPESVITITELFLFSCFSRKLIFAYFMFHGVSSRPIGRAAGQGCLAEGYLLMSMALLITSGEAARIASLIAWVSKPD